MNTPRLSIFFFVLLSATAISLNLSGCASMESANTESLLSAAGFRVRTPETPRQKEIYASLPPYQMQRATVKSGVFYVFKDEKKAVAYVGREPEYQRYRQLAVQQRIAENYYMAAEMEREAAWRWYGGWGPHRFWR